MLSRLCVAGAVLQTSYVREGIRKTKQKHWKCDHLPSWPGVQKVDRGAIWQNTFCQTNWVLRRQRNLSDGCTVYVQLYDDLTAYIQLSDAWSVYVQLSNGRTVNVQLSDDGTVFIQLSDDWTVYIKLSNSGAVYVKLSDGWTVYVQLSYGWTKSG